METDRRVDRAKAAVSAPLHDLYKEKVLETRCVQLEILAGVVTVVENIVSFDDPESLGWQINARFEITVVILRNGERFNAVRFKLACRRYDVIGLKCNMLDARAEILVQKAGRLSVLALRRIKHDAQSAVGGLHHLAANDAAGIGNVELRRLLYVKKRCVKQEPG